MREGGCGTPLKRHSDLSNKAAPIFTHLAPHHCQGIQFVGLHVLDLRDIQVHADEVFAARCINPGGALGLSRRAGLPQSAIAWPVLVAGHSPDPRFHPQLFGDLQGRGRRLPLPESGWDFLSGF